MTNRDMPTTAKPSLFQPDRSPEEQSASFRRLFDLKRSFRPKPNKDKLVAALIGGCILEGFDTYPRIIGAQRALGVKQAHAISILNGATGEDPGRHLWWLNAEGKYCLHG